jgi:hypothetical protein
LAAHLRLYAFLTAPHWSGSPNRFTHHRYHRHQMRADASRMAICTRETKTMRALFQQAVRALARAFTDRSDDATSTDWSYEQHALRILQQEGALDLATLIDRVADRAMHAAKIGGGAALDVAVWGPSIFHIEAEAAVRRMIGLTLVLESDGPWMLVVPTTRSVFQAVRPQHAAGAVPVPA